MRMIVLRGVSGSGKTTKAKELTKEFQETNPDAITFVCSTDRFFVNPISGKYEFDSSKIASAHAWCKGSAYAACELGVDLIIIDNTNTQRWEWEPYEKMSASYGYDFEICVVGSLDADSLKVYANRNLHGVPLETIKRMAKRFDP